MPAVPTTTSAAHATPGWRRAHAGSGVTSGLILSYVERLAGRDGVERTLALAGLAGREQEFRDEDTWFSFETKIALWDAAIAVTGEPRLPERVGESVLDFTVALGLKRALRALGSPDFVYRNVVRANSKFNWAHTLDVQLRDRGRVRLVYRDVAGVGYHRHDCEYAIGLLRAVPQLFGLPAARVLHGACGARGAQHCEFDIHWSDGAQGLKRTTLLVTSASAGVAAVGAFVDPALLAAGAGLGVFGAAVAGARAVTFMRRRIEALESRVREQDAAAEAQLESLAALSSQLRLDQVLESISRSASSAIAGAEFALLIAEEGRVQATHTSSIPAESLRALERWAQQHQGDLGTAPAVIDDLSEHPELRALSASPELPAGSMCAAPMVFRDDWLGVLIALAHGTTVFLPQDMRALEIYAGHAAVALSNARLVERLEREATEDPLTGLSNKRVFQLAYAAELSRAQREQAPLALAILDIDHFKDINDTFGHPFGDRVLVEAATSLRGSVRGHDTLARLGGEEFALLLPGTTLAEAHAVAERARALLGAIQLPDRNLSASAGVAAIDGSASRGQDLLAAADQALYDAKRQGRDRTSLASEAGDLVT